MTEQNIYISSLYGYNTGQPAVSLKIDGVEVSQMSPAKAREVAMMLLISAEAAVGDAFIFSFLTERIQADTRQAAGLLREFRDWRIEHKVDEEAQP